MFKVDTVLFDFDGTLIEIEIDFRQMRRGVLELGKEYDVSAQPGLYVLESLDDIFNKLKSRDANTALEFRQKAEKLIMDIELDAAEKARLLPGVDAALRKLKDMGIKIGIVTRNCRAGVMKSAETFHLVYDLLLARDDVEKVKPHPKHLFDALNILDTKPEKALMVGNHPMDILAGEKAGMKTVAVLTTQPKEDFQKNAPDLILSGVPDLIENIAGPG